MKNIKKTLDFIQLTNTFRKIERDIPLSKEKRCENDMEHSYQLAVVSWYIANIENLDLDVSKIIKYSIVHDLVEIYAGDTPLYSSTASYLRSKASREFEARIKLQKNFPEFSELHTLIECYEKKQCPESRFVYAVDKLLPILSIYLDKGYAWKSHNLNLNTIVKMNDKRIATFPQLTKYLNYIVKILKEKPEYFIK